MLNIFNLLCLGLWIWPAAAAAGEKETSCRKVVQEFYGWYAPLAVKDNGATPAWMIAVRKKPSLFSKTLADALRKDSAAQERSQEIVGLDFDPFLNSQDPDTDYAAQYAEVKDGKCRVHVGRSQAQAKPHVIAELRGSPGKWVFADFYYPDAGKAGGLALLGILKEQATARDKYAAEHPAAGAVPERPAPRKPGVKVMPRIEPILEEAQTIDLEKERDPRIADFMNQISTGSR